MNINKVSGNQFEKRFCQILFDNGFWVHNFAQTAMGQPADVIAVKRRKAYLIDCKVCKNGKFPFSRVEPNQDSSMFLWKRCGNGCGMFALLLENQIYLLTYSALQDFRKQGLTGLNTEQIKQLLPLEEWLERL